MGEALLEDIVTDQPQSPDPGMINADIKPTSLEERTFSRFAPPKAFKHNRAPQS
jgi:hypothetical protein